MNLVIDDAVEVKQITKTNSEEKRRQLGTAYPITSDIMTRPFANELTGQILLKGDNVSLIQEAV
jgi:small nuclear ribonucleoprotein E